MLSGVGSMMLGAFKIGGAKVKKGVEYALIVAQGLLEAGTSLTAGDNFAKAIEKGGLKIASAGGAQALLSASWVKAVFSKVPVPFTVWGPAKRVGDIVIQEDVADAVVEKTTKKLIDKGLKSVIARGVDGLASKKGQADKVSSGLIEEVPMEQLFLLDLAIVNMQKGIGRGW